MDGPFANESTEIRQYSWKILQSDWLPGKPTSYNILKAHRSPFVHDCLTHGLRRHELKSQSQINVLDLVSKAYVFVEIMAD